MKSYLKVYLIEIQLVKLFYSSNKLVVGLGRSVFLRYNFKFI